TGGAWAFVNIGPDGQEYAFHGSFHDVTDDRIVQTFTFDGWPEEVSLETLRVEDLGGGWARLHATSLLAPSRRAARCSAVTWRWASTRATPRSMRCWPTGPWAEGPIALPPQVVAALPAGARERGQSDGSAPGPSPWSSSTRSAARRSGLSWIVISCVHTPCRPSRRVSRGPTAERVCRTPSSAGALSGPSSSSSPSAERASPARRCRPCSRHTSNTADPCSCHSCGGARQPRTWQCVGKEESGMPWSVTARLLRCSPCVHRTPDTPEHVEGTDRSDPFGRRSGRRDRPTGAAARRGSSGGCRRHQQRSEFLGDDLGHGDGPVDREVGVVLDALGVQRARAGGQLGEQSPRGLLAELLDERAGAAVQVQQRHVEGLREGE